MSGYRHGVYVSEVPTQLLPPRTVASAMPVIFGTAPIEDKLDKKINEPVLCYTYAEFVEAFGESDDWAKYTLCEAADAIFGKYGVAPAVFVNVYDPATHLNDSENPDPIKVTGADIIGGIDADTLQKTGLELLSEVFPRFRLVPCQVLAPRFSSEPDVAIVMAAKAASINGIFRAMALVDVPADTVTKYTDVPSYKETNNLTDERMLVCWPKATLGDRVYHKSTQLAGLMASVDADSGGVPFRSASNQRLLIDGVRAGDKAVHLDLEQANYLNGNGVISALNFDGGWKCWGSRTAAYPSMTDPKDAWAPIRRFFDWHGNTFILTYFQSVDWPLRRRTIQTIVDSENVRLNGFTSREYILGGRMSFLESENPATDLMDGLLRFHTWMTPPSPARAIENILEYDPSYLQSLFG